MMADGRQLSIVMTAALSAEFDGRVPADLVADLVRAVLDESRRLAHDRGVESSTAEARQRLERFIRARSSVQQLICATTKTRQPEQTGDEPNGMAQC
jgi:hypothetical protein